jgi:Tol biopolymer transport system component
LATVVFSTAVGGAAASPKRGGKIAFYSDRDGPFEIYVMKASGSVPRRLTTTTKPEDVGTSKEQAALWPRWSMASESPSNLELRS